MILQVLEVKTHCILKRCFLSPPNPTQGNGQHDLMIPQDTSGYFRLKGQKERSWTRLARQVGVPEISGVLGESWAGRQRRRVWEGSGKPQRAAEAWLKRLRARQSRRSPSQWQRGRGAGTVPGALVTQTRGRGSQGHRCKGCSGQLLLASHQDCGGVTGGLGGSRYPEPLSAR